MNGGFHSPFSSSFECIPEIHDKSTFHGRSPNPMTTGIKHFKSLLVADLMEEGQPTTAVFVLIEEAGGNHQKFLRMANVH